MIEKNISDFAIKTKHKQIDLQGHLREQLLVKKLIATQVPDYVGWRSVFKMVSNDMDRIEYKAPQSLTNFSKNPNLSLGFFTELLGDQVYNSPIIDDFAKTVNAPNGLELALFFSNKIYNTGQFIGDLEDVCDNIDKVNNLYKSLIDYKYDHEYLNESIIDISNVINGFDFEKVLDGMIIQHTSYNINKNASVKKRLGSNTIEFKESDVHELTLDVEKTLRKNEAVVAYKIKHGLPTQYPSEKIYNDMLASSDTKSNALDIIDYFSQEKIDGIINCKQAQTFYHIQNLKQPQKNLTKQQFIKNLFKDESVMSSEVIDIIKN